MKSRIPRHRSKGRLHAGKQFYPKDFTTRVQRQRNIRISISIKITEGVFWTRFRKRELFLAP